MYCKYIDIIASNIPKMKITAVSQWTARFNIQAWYAGVYLEISLLGCLTTKKFQDFSITSAKFHAFPGLFSNSRTFQDWLEPCPYKSDAFKWGKKVQKKCCLRLFWAIWNERFSVSLTWWVTFSFSVIFVRKTQKSFLKS